MLAVSRDCHFCTESVPFYRTLIAAAESAGVSVTVATQDTDPEKTRHHFASLGLQVADLRRVAFSAIGIKATPTLMVIDRSGTIKQVRVGQLPPDEEREMIASVSHPASK